MTDKLLDPSPSARRCLCFVNWTGLSLQQLAEAGRIGDPDKTAKEVANTVLGPVEDFDKLDERNSLIEEVADVIRFLHDS